jgi:hypothetical protein
MGVVKHNTGHWKSTAYSSPSTAQQNQQAAGWTVPSLAMSQVLLSMSIKSWDTPSQHCCLRWPCWDHQVPRYQTLQW